VNEFQPIQPAVPIILMHSTIVPQVADTDSGLPTVTTIPARFFPQNVSFVFARGNATRMNNRGRQQERLHVSIGLLTPAMVLPELFSSVRFPDVSMALESQSMTLDAACDCTMDDSGTLHCTKQGDQLVTSTPPDDLHALQLADVGRLSPHGVFTHELVTLWVDTSVISGIPPDNAVQASLRFVTEVMVDSPVPFPQSLLARRRFDADFIVDVSRATGIARNRWVVTNTFADTGVVVFHCLPPTSATDLACMNGIDLLLMLAGKRATVLITGIVGWALDALYPAATIDMTDGRPHTNGSCTNPELLNEDACLNAGSCRCAGIPRNNRKLCEASYSFSGSQCVFTPEYRWNPAAKTPLRYGKCSNPRIISESECKSAGTCSNKHLKSLEECLAVGTCQPPKDLLKNALKSLGQPPFVIDFRQFKTREECLHPSIRLPRDANALVDASIASEDASDMANQYDTVGGDWVSENSFHHDNKWNSGAKSVDPCPCAWAAQPLHLTKCNWHRCGPGAKGTSSDGVTKIVRNKDSVEMVSDYQSFANVGGMDMWMNLGYRHKYILGHVQSMLYGRLSGNRAVCWGIHSHGTAHLHRHRFAGTRSHADWFHVGLRRAYHYDVWRQVYPGCTHRNGHP
jgi:hypothetical protein